MPTRHGHRSGASEADLQSLGFQLGADVPMCLAGRPSIARGAGERLEPALAPPDCALVLANPGVPTPTGAVFRAFDEGPPPPSQPHALPDSFAGTAGFAAALRAARNDLEPPARRLVPVIDDVLALLNTATGCFLARMSGSGATCFAVFDTPAEARQACAQVRHAKPDWWAVATRFDTSANSPAAGGAQEKTGA
ncbi:MAG: hypothetical protein AAGL49_06705 [Pseudomonadota bacterium]